MKIIYLTWGETPRSYGVFGSQVVGQFVENSKVSKKDHFYFISAVPIINSGLVREKWRYFTEIKRIKEKLGRIKFFWIPILATQNLVNSNKMSFNLMHGVSHWFLKNILNNIKPDVVHCRSYHAAWAAMVVRKKYSMNYKVIFDGRGLWPEEVALKRKWEEGERDYQFLKSIELKLLSECDCSIAVSDTMHKHYTKLGAKKVKCIYLSVDTEELKVDIRQINKENNIVRFCYVGALSDDTWHQPNELLVLYRKLRKFFPKSILTIVTTSNHDRLKEKFSEFPEEELLITEAKTRFELKEILKKQDFGLMSYFTPKTEKERLLGNVVLAVKTAEYFVTGLPMICNSYCGGAAKMINKYSLGVTYNPDKIDSLSVNELLPYFNLNTRIQIQDFALKNFDYQVNAYRYTNIYKNILGLK